jgi:hypothetical protein
MKIIQIPAKNSNHNSPATYKPGDPLPPSHIKVNALETLQRHANRWEADTRAGRPTVENPNPPIVRTFPQRQRAAATTAQSGKKVAA